MTAAADASAGMVLVTGATGFIGRHLCAELARRGVPVRAAARRPGPPSAGVGWVAVPDVGPATNWDEALAGVERVVHLAGVAHRHGVPAAALADEFGRVNRDGTRRLAEESARHGVRRFVFVSSIGAVASSSSVPVSESTPCRPEPGYGASKLEAERELRRVLAGTAVEWTIVRPPLVYGPGDPGNMARLLKLVRTGLPLPFGAVRNRRSFVYVGNLVDLLVRCLDAPGAAGEVFVVGDGTDLSTAELVGRLARLARLPVRLVRFPPALLRLAALAGDAVRLVARRSVGIDSDSVDRLLGSLVVDAAKARFTLGWTPPFGSDEGLAATVAALQP